MPEWILSSSILILVVICLRTVLKGKISLRLQYALWGLVLLRLLIPVSFGNTAFSVANLTEEPVREPQLSVQAHTSPAQPSQTIHEMMGEDVQVFHEQANSVEQQAGIPRNQPITPEAALPFLWAMGFISVAGVFLVTNGRFKRKIMDSRYPLDIRKNGLEVYATAEIDTPCLFGLKKPAIYVTYPVAEDKTLLRHTLEHEATHHRHGDHFWAVLRCVCLAIHWYNPLVWWAAFLSRQDGELACDEATIKRLGEGERAEYGRTLIGMTCQKKANVLITATTMNSGKRSLRERILLIAKKPKMAVYTLIAVVLIAAIAVGCTFTGPNDPRMEVYEKILPEYLEQYTYEQMKDRMEPEDIRYYGGSLDHSLVFCSGTGPQLRLYCHDIIGEDITITDWSEGEFALSGGLSVNHITDGDAHIYFGSISDSHWIPGEDSQVPLDWGQLTFLTESGDYDVNVEERLGYLFVSQEPITGFQVVSTDGTILLTMEQYLAQGYSIRESEWYSDWIYAQSTEPSQPITEPTQVPTAPAPTEIPDNAPPVNIPEMLHEQPDPDKICIAVMPTAIATSGEDWYYIIPENQELLMEYYQAAAANATKLSWDNDVKQLGWKILYQDEWWIVKENGAILCDLYGDKAIAPEDSKALYAFCRDAVQEAGVGDPVRPEDIQGITSATLYWNGIHTVTQPYILKRIETLFSNSRDYGSIQCWMDARLELTLENGETLVLAIATDSCASWMSEGVAYGYGEVTNVGIEGNEEFYSFFLTDIIHEKAQEGPEAMAEYWPYIHWGEYSTRYGHAEAFRLLYMFEDHILSNPTDWNIYVTLTTARSADGAYAEFYAHLIGELFEEAPTTFNFACRQMVPEKYVDAAVDFLAYYWEITPEEARDKLDAASATE